MNSMKTEVEDIRKEPNTAYKNEKQKTEMKISLGHFNSRLNTTKGKIISEIK